MKKLLAVVALALSAASLSAVATNTDRHGEAASPAASECITPWSFDRPPFGRCPDR